MKIARHLSLFDLVVAIIAATAILLPARSMTAAEADRGNAEDRAALAGAEAWARAHPGDGAAVAELSRLLARTGHFDLAVVVAAVGSEGRNSDRWRAQLATSVALSERFEAKAALEWADVALATCRAVGATACPSWEEVRLDIYKQYLDAGVRSGIDPKVDPQGFRAAGEAGLRPVRLGP